MKTFYVGIKGVIIKDGKVLMLRANTETGRRDMWGMPGGRIDNDETIISYLTYPIEQVYWMLLVRPDEILSICTERVIS